MEGKGWWEHPWVWGQGPGGANCLHFRKQGPNLLNFYHLLLPIVISISS